MDENIEVFVSEPLFSFAQESALYQALRRDAKIEQQHKKLFKGLSVKIKIDFTADGFQRATTVVSAVHPLQPAAVFTFRMPNWSRDAKSRNRCTVRGHARFCAFFARLYAIALLILSS